MYVCVDFICIVVGGGSFGDAVERWWWFWEGMVGWVTIQLKGYVTGIDYQSGIPI